MKTKTALTFLILLGSFVATHAQTVKTLYSFGAPGEPANPWIAGTLSQSPGGNLISTAAGVLSSAESTAYELPVSGKSLTILQDFGNDGSGLAFGGLTLATDERFHGTLATGGAHGDGAVFHISSTPLSDVTYEHDFTGGTDGSYPVSSPIQSMAGDFYGTTSGQSPISGDQNDGTVYKITKNGVYSVLHTFSGADGSNPIGALVQSTDGSFYGTTSGGGKYGQGTIFRVNSDGSFKTLYSLKGGAGGGSPNGPLIIASDGNLYGTAQGGTSTGLAFRITPGGTYTVLHNFDGGHGAFPYGGLMQATDGNLYGALYSGGAGDWGTLYRLTLSGAFTDIHDFNGSDGIEPVETLLQHTNGKLYGQAYLGGPHNGGTLFEVDLGLAPFVTYLNVYGVVGSKVVILGQGFEDGVTKVYFNGVEAEIDELNPTYLKAIVPEGATTGWITVKTAGVTLKSNKTFIVH